MRFIHKWSYGCARYLAIQLKENNEKRRVYYYGFQIVFGVIVKIALLIGISAIFGSLVPALISILAFVTFRLLGGGYHMDTYGKCITISLAFFIGLSIFTQYTYKYWNNIEIQILILVTLFTSIYVTIKWVPKDTPNKPINDLEEKKKFKRLSFYYIVIWFIIMIIIFNFGFQNYKLFIIAGCVGFLFELFSISPIGHKFFDRISGKVDTIIN